MYLRTPRIEQHHSDVEECKIRIPVAVALLPRYCTHGSPTNVDTQLLPGRDLVGLQFSLSARRGALDSSSLHIDYPEQGGSSMGTRSWGSLPCRLLYCCNVLSVVLDTQFCRTSLDVRFAGV